MKTIFMQTNLKEKLKLNKSLQRTDVGRGIEQLDVKRGDKKKTIFLIPQGMKGQQLRDFMLQQTILSDIKNKIK